jgi:hypothetical protein
LERNKAKQFFRRLCNLVWRTQSHLEAGPDAVPHSFDGLYSSGANIYLNSHLFGQRNHIFWWKNRPELKRKFRNTFGDSSLTLGARSKSNCFLSIFLFSIYVFLLSFFCCFRDLVFIGQKAWNTYVFFLEKCYLDFNDFPWFHLLLCIYSI